MEIAVHQLEKGARDHSTVEAVEGGGEVGGEAQSVETDQHLEDKGTEENLLAEVWEQKVEKIASCIS